MSEEEAIEIVKQMIIMCPINSKEMKKELTAIHIVLDLYEKEKEKTKQIEMQLQMKQKQEV